jgi:hypothetical protein
MTFSAVISKSSILVFTVLLACTTKVATKTPATPKNLSVKDVAAQSQSAVVLIIARKPNGSSSVGSGFHIGGGFVATNYHVISGCDVVALVKGEDEPVGAESVVAYNQVADLALLGVEAAREWPALKLGETNDLHPGDRLVVLGNPQGLVASVSDGILSAQRDTNGVSLLQLTAPISHGSSGGPVLDLRGEVVGVTTFYLTGGQSLNFAVSVDELRGLTYDPVSIEDFGTRTSEPAETTTVASQEVVKSSTPTWLETYLPAVLLNAASQNKSEAKRLCTYFVGAEDKTNVFKKSTGRSGCYYYVDDRKHHIVFAYKKDIITEVAHIWQCLDPEQVATNLTSELNQRPEVGTNSDHNNVWQWTYNDGYLWVSTDENGCGVHWEIR